MINNRNNVRKGARHVFIELHVMYLLSWHKHWVWINSFHTQIRRTLWQHTNLDVKIERVTDTKVQGAHTQTQLRTELKRDACFTLSNMCFNIATGRLDFTSTDIHQEFPV